MTLNNIVVKQYGTNQVLISFHGSDLKLTDSSQFESLGFRVLNDSNKNTFVTQKIVPSKVDEKSQYPFAIEHLKQVKQATEVQLFYADNFYVVYVSKDGKDKKFYKFNK